MRSAITSKTHTIFGYIKSIPLLCLILLKNGFAPKIGAMQNLRLSIHAPEHIWLRQLFIQRRLQLGLSQRALAERLNVIHSFIGKVETGDRRLDILEFILYCQALEIICRNRFTANPTTFGNIKNHLFSNEKRRAKIRF